MVSARLSSEFMELNRVRRVLACCLSMILSENRFSLCANAALRVRIMLTQSKKEPPETGGFES
jgi:hypothetical protein